MLHNWSQTQGREKCKRAHDHNHTYQQRRKSGVVTGKVPSDGGTVFLRARFPAIASIGIIMKKRPTSIVMPIVVLYQ